MHLHLAERHLLVTATPSGTEETPITLAEGRSLTECISAAPKPGCVTRTDADSHQIAVFGVLVAGLAFVGWRITRGVRRARRAVMVPAPPSPMGSSSPSVPPA